jgi:hypothetical protein
MAYRAGGRSRPPLGPVECGTNHLKRHRQSPTGYDELTVRYEATVLIATLNEGAGSEEAMRTRLADAKVDAGQGGAGLVGMPPGRGLIPGRSCHG